MKIVVAPDSFKESLDAAGAAHAIVAGMQRVLPHARYDLVPMADGGEGTVTAMVAATGGELVEREVTGPLGDKVAAHYGILGDGRTAVIEIAAASGLALVPPERRNPMRTTSFGTGELIRDALSRPLDKIIVGLGGSATNEGGIGLCQALGVRFVDQQGNVIAAPIDGERLTAVADFDLAGPGSPDLRRALRGGLRRRQSSVGSTWRIGDVRTAKKAQPRHRWLGSTTAWRDYFSCWNGAPDSR